MYEEFLKFWVEWQVFVVFVMYDFEEVVVLVDKVYVLIVGFVMVKFVYMIDLLCLCVVFEICYEQGFIDYCKMIWEDLCQEVEISYCCVSEVV